MPEHRVQRLRPQTTAKGILSGVGQIAPAVTVGIDWEEDPGFRWDGEGPDPAEEGYVPYTVTVVAEAESAETGDTASGMDSLGGVYEKPHIQDPDVHGYFPDMIYGALHELYKELTGVAPPSPKRKRWDPRLPVAEDIPEELEEVLTQIREALRFVSDSRDAINTQQMRRRPRRRRRQRR